MRDMGSHGSPDPHYMIFGETLWDLPHLHWNSGSVICEIHGFELFGCHVDLWDKCN